MACHQVHEKIRACRHNRRECFSSSSVYPRRPEKTIKSISIMFLLPIAGPLLYHCPVSSWMWVCGCALINLKRHLALIYYLRIMSWLCATKFMMCMQLMALSMCACVWQCVSVHAREIVHTAYTHTHNLRINNNNNKWGWTWYDATWFDRHHITHIIPL